MAILGIVSSVFNNVIYDEILPYKQENTLKMVLAVFLGVSIVQITEICMALVTGVILFRVNIGFFAIIVFMTLISILLVLIFEQPYKKINEEQIQQFSGLNS